MKIVITGYTYTRENLFEVFESYPEKKDLYFIRTMKAEKHRIFLQIIMGQ